ncbi:hypothetical protein VF04_36945 [Nostoc linckia z7]|uniref:Uncharacterized protein n=2 Tax=Nostoc linckia TaxID=92942 RepID=A0A9Q5Z3Y5_NOSLI|nr:hypothetical protein [Nostoc linckia]PHJ55895.1 hypothetical protein VF03_38050 [Nostoc linckia z2]PHJ83062.1 hypothetical protein VF04_36945 [Nostoc linckia z7]PHJ88736.1 hypothetical protein VF08_37925 [Nostoc linckia z8]PHJ94447.1 hypothetical protein VF09_37065 [Nostoc linckia z9]
MTDSRQPTNINTQLKHVQEKQHHSAKQTPQETRTQATPLWLVFIRDARTFASTKSTISASSDGNINTPGVNNGQQTLSSPHRRQHDSQPRKRFRYHTHGE